MNTLALNTLSAPRAASLRGWLVHTVRQNATLLSQRLVAGRMVDVSRRLAVTHPALAAELRAQARDVLGAR